MIKKLTLLVGVGAGYVLGAKAGREKYDQIVVKANDLLGRPQVQNATATVTQKAGDLAEKAKDVVNDKVESVTGSSGTTDTTRTTSRTPAPSTVDLTTTAPLAKPATPSTTAPAPVTGAKAPTTATGPMAGAAPSKTAPGA